jgi:hypothetical protein
MGKSMPASTCTGLSVIVRMTDAGEVIEDAHIHSDPVALVKGATNSIPSCCRCIIFVQQSPSRCRRPTVASTGSGVLTNSSCSAVQAAAHGEAAVGCNGECRP